MSENNHARSTGEVEQMEHRELRNEYEDILDQLHRGLPPRGEDVYDRRDELWDEMVSRVDAEPPECPICDSQKWSQSVGDAKICTGCGKALGEKEMDLIEAVDDYWEIVLSGGEAELAVTDGGPNHVDLVEPEDVDVQNVHRKIRTTHLGIETIIEEMLPHLDADAEWSKEDIEGLSNRLESIRESLYRRRDDLVEAELALEVDNAE